jgi:anti-sigma factor RsiW
MADERADEHEWLRSRLDLWATGLLDEDEERRFDRHVAACERCAQAMKRFREHLPEARTDVHVPARLLARWDRAQRRLRGLPRRLVREHLASCAACRQDLEALGFSPTLEVVPELEGELKDRGAPQSVESPPRSVVIVQGGRTGWSRWGHWLLAGAAGAAATAALAVVIMPQLRGSAGPSQASPTIPSPSAPVTAPQQQPVAPPVFEILPEAPRLRAPERGLEPADRTIRIRPGARFVQVVLPDLFLSDSTRISIELYDPSGALVSTIGGAYGDVGPRESLLLGRPDRPLEPGRHRIVVRAPSARPTMPPTEFGFRIEHEP